MILTIFTPTYNRAYTLPNLYNSLVEQSSKKFVWLIVDDGSHDNTKELVDSWIKENKIKIKYYYQKNQGKSIAHNKGVAETKTELFCCVDSDDYLVKESVETILDIWKTSHRSNIIGVLAFIGHPNVKPITTLKKYDTPVSTLGNAYRSLGLQGDTMLIYETDIIKKYKFPKFHNEKFVPEAYLYDLLDQEGKLIILTKVLYIGEYLEDGYTANINKLLLNNPNGYLAFISQRLKLEKKIIYKFCDTIRYTSFSIASKQKKIISNSVCPFITALTYPLGYLFYYIRYKKYDIEDEKSYKNGR